MDVHGLDGEARVALEPLLPLVSTQDRGRVTLHLAECDYHLGRHKAARDRLKEYLDDGPKDAEARYYYLSAARGMGDRSTYVRLSRALVKEFPDSPWAAETLDDLASYYIIDESSRNGTCINGQPLVAGVRMSVWSGAYVSFGDAVFVFIDPPTLRKLSRLAG